MEVIGTSDWILNAIDGGCGLAPQRNGVDTNKQLIPYLKDKGVIDNKMF
jgi:hypothetical protein